MTPPSTPSTAAPSRSPAWLRPALIGALVAAALAATAGMGGPAVRGLAVLAFLALGPGLALVGLLGLPDPWQEVALVVGVSLALDVVVVGTLAYAGQRSSSPAFAILVAIALAGAVAQLIRPTSRREHSERAHL